MAREELVNEFSWSASSAKHFGQCRRFYFNKHYATWGGWEKDSPARRAYVLSKLTGRQGWAGKAVHSMISSIITRRLERKPLDESITVRELHEKMRREFKESAARKYRDAPKKFVGLREHEYEEDINPKWWAENWEHAKRCLLNFWKTALFVDALQSKPLLALENLHGFDVDGIMHWVVLDIAFRRNGRVHVGDWKTGKPTEDDRDQLVTYAAYATAQWGVPISDVTGHLVYLSGEDPEEIPIEFTAEDLSRWKEKVIADVSEVSTLLVGGDLKKNVPLPVENWPMLPLGSKLCRYCEFKGLCGRDGKPEYPKFERREP